MITWSDPSPQQPDVTARDGMTSPQLRRLMYPPVSIETEAGRPPEAGDTARGADGSDGSRTAVAPPHGFLKAIVAPFFTLPRRLLRRLATRIAVPPEGDRTASEPEVACAARSDETAH